jgi:hypothetical protein
MGIAMILELNHPHGEVDVFTTHILCVWCKQPIGQNRAGHYH